MVKSRRRERAQALVEFAFSVPVFLMLLLGFIDFSRLMFSYVSLVNGTMEIARAAAIPASTSPMIVTAFNNATLIAASENPASDSITITVYPGSGLASTSVVCNLPLTVATCAVPSRTGADDGYVSVAANYQFNFSPLFQSVLGGVAYAGLVRPFTTLTATATAYIE